MTLATWLGFLTACILVSISPGAGAINTMSSASRFGLIKTLPSILGLQVGLLIHILVISIGLGALLAASEHAFTVIKWVGVAYLIWLGIQKWRESPEPAHIKTNALTWKLKPQLLKAVLVNLTNPKAIVFLGALLPQFIDPSQPAVPQISLLTITMITVDMIVMVGFALLAGQLQNFVSTRKHLILQNRLFGSLFIGAGGLLASWKA
ncbi:homoserine/homoserine lactone efflux protein [Kistimonas scapharcae]|uniref:Homoserine/homoserine lactone efflux protein n=1 Tax=Kistimonas scapharcae TaxID=1036133 RepID=A0ABP8V395_9GAMM